MYGLAQKLFYGTEGTAEEKRYPLLSQFLQEGLLPYVDFALAENVLSRFPAGSEALAALICHLSLAVRKGHLCIQVSDAEIAPPMHELWMGERPLTSDEAESLQDLIINAKDQLCPPLCTFFTEEEFSFVDTPLCCLGDLIYFQRHWQAENTVINHFNALLKAIPVLQIDAEKLQEQLRKNLQTKKLLPEQAQAILHAAQSSLTIICGGPGTGKTYTAGFLVRLFWEGLSAEQKERCQIALAAPTGKAAANLQKSLTTATQDLPGFKSLVAKTLHNILGIKSSGRRREESKLAADLLIIDESSMIDVQLMGHLLKAVKSGARVIFLGDPYQLPSVEAGSAFADMLKNPNCQATMLQTCMRAELKEIVDFAQACKEGNQNAFIAMLSEGKAVRRLEWEMESERKDLFLEALFNYTQGYFQNNYSNEKDILAAFNRFRILSPLRQGPFGVNAINHYFFQRIVKQNPRGKEMIIPIMLLKNNAHLELFNGEVGALVLQGGNRDFSNYRMQKGDYALFPCATNELGVRKVPALLLPRFEYAYCLSVHKSQGSEFENELCLMPEGSEYFGREVLYTAVTRARKRLEIVGSDEVLRKALGNKSERLSRKFLNS